MGITKEETGNYLGYTQADPMQLPTLYFEKGRITQQYHDSKNVGWHPQEKENWYRGNFKIKNGAIAEGAPVNGDIGHDPDRFGVIDIITNGWEEAIADAKNGVYLMEGIYNIGEKHLRLSHVSRSRLLRYGADRESGFDMQYGESYAQSARKKTSLASNENRTF